MIASRTRLRARTVLVAGAAAVFVAAFLPAGALGAQAGAGPAFALQIASHTSTDLSVSARPSDNGTWALEAHVRQGESAAIGGIPVRFSATVEFLGTRKVDIGTASTDASGTATLIYRPTWNGLHRIVARARFDDGLLDSDEILLEVSGAGSPLTATEARLPVIGPWAGPVAAAVATVVWGLLALVFVRVVLGISRAAPTTAPDAKGGTRT